MNANWAIGFVIGFLVVTIACVVIAKAIRRKDGHSGKYDERQQAARGRAFCWAYSTIMIYLLFWMILRSMEIPFFMEPLSVALGALLSIAVFAGYCIFSDAYFKSSESPRSWIGIISAIGLVNLGIGLIRLFRESTLKERLYDNMNLFVGLLMVITLICVLIKRAMDRQSEAE